MSVAIQQVGAACFAESGWRDGFLAQFRKRICDSPGLTKSDLAAATAELATEFLQQLYWDGVSDKLPVVDLPVVSQNSVMRLQLTSYLSEGTYGMVFQGQLTDVSGAGSATDLIVKVVNPTAPDFGDGLTPSQELANEVLVQSWLHCTAADLGMTPNPIPAIRAPVALHATQSPGLMQSFRALWGSPSGGVPAVAMDNAGITLSQWIGSVKPTGAAVAHFWLILYTVARILRDLQAAVGFVHADLHANNITVAPTAPQLITLDGRSYELPYSVAIIDFGKACMVAQCQGRAVELHVDNPDSPTNFSALCNTFIRSPDGRFASPADPAILGGYLILELQELASQSPVWVRPLNALKSFMRPAWRQVYPWIPRWDGSILQRLDDAIPLQEVAAKNTVTTPAALMTLCGRQLRSMGIQGIL